MKIKVAFVTKQLIMGGIERSLITLLNHISFDKFDVTIYVMKSGGELVDQLPNEVKIKNIFGKETTTIEKVRKYIRKGELITSFKTVLYTYLLKRGATSRFKENIYYSNMLPIEDVNYDLAIAYYIPTSLPVIYTMNNLIAKEKAAWIHSDVTEFKTILPNYRVFYEQYNYIFGVSNFTVNKFNEIFPHLKERTSLFYNIFEKEKLELLSAQDESFYDKYEGFRILTVGRLAQEKGYDLIPKVLSKLLEKGYDVRWYCIGEGNVREKLESMITDYNLEEHLILLGNKENPYPYIKDCDIYVQPSRHEAYCITVAEARMFHKPIITTDTGASEQIKHGKTGLVVQFDEEKMYEAVKRLLNDDILRGKFTRNLSKETEDTKSEIDKFNQITNSM